MPIYLKGEDNIAPDEMTEDPAKYECGDPLDVRDFKVSPNAEDAMRSLQRAAFAKTASQDS